MSDANRLLKLLKQNILDLIDDIKNNIFVEEREQHDMVMLEYFFNNIISENKLMESVQNSILPHKKYIIAHDKEFFIKNNSIFSSLPEDRVKHYITVITSKLDKENEDAIFKYFNVIIKIAEKHKNL